MATTIFGWYRCCWQIAVLVVLLFTVVTPPTMASSSSFATITTNSAATTTSRALDCNPCIDRTRVVLGVVLPPPSSSFSSSATTTTANDDDGQPTMSILERGMQQAAQIDMHVELQIRYATSWTDMADAYRSLLGQHNNNKNNNNDAASESTVVDALLITVPHPTVEETLRQLAQEYPHIPMFGWGNMGNHENDDEEDNEQITSLLSHAIGWMSNDEAATGRMAAELFWNPNNDTRTSATTITNDSVNNNNNKPVAIVSADPVTVQQPQWQSPVTRRMEAFSQRWQELVLLNSNPAVNISNTSEMMAASNLPQVELVLINDNQQQQQQQQQQQKQEDILERLFQNCPYQALLLDDTILTADWYQDIFDQASRCGTALGTVLGDSPLTPYMYKAITKGQLAFALDTQVALQASMTVVTAALYVTTGKAIAKPLIQQSYHTGPKLVQARNVPSDTAALCEQGAFPVCPAVTTSLNTGSTTIDEEIYVGRDPITGKEWYCPCTPRRTLRIGGVFHGATTDSFWDPVFAAAEQAAVDMGITLELERLQPQSDFSIIVDQMAARIRNLCDSGIDGLFVSIPSPVVIPAIQRCQDLRVPVLSVNSGQDVSQQLGLLHHLGQNEFLGGYQAAQRLMQAGMKRGCKYA